MIPRNCAKFRKGAAIHGERESQREKRERKRENKGSKREKIPALFVSITPIIETHYDSRPGFPSNLTVIEVINMLTYLDSFKFPTECERSQITKHCGVY